MESDCQNNVDPNNNCGKQSIITKIHCIHKSWTLIPGSGSEFLIIKKLKVNIRN